MSIGEWDFGPRFVPEYKRKEMSDAESELLRRVLDDTFIIQEVEDALAPAAAELGLSDELFDPDQGYSV